MGLGLAARGLWITAGSWCANRLTDGFVPSAALSRFGATKRHAAELVSAGLWTEVENGYQFWDWLHFQPSKERVLADRIATSRRVSRHRNAVTPTVTNAVTNGRVTLPPVPDPVPVPVLPQMKIAPENHQMGTMIGNPRTGVGLADPEEEAAYQGRVRLRAILPNLEHDHRGKWKHALAELSRKPDEEWSLAAATLTRAARGHRAGQILNPRHILDYWTTYRAGALPGQRPPKAAAAPTEPYRYGPMDFGDSK